MPCAEVFAEKGHSVSGYDIKEIHSNFIKIDLGHAFLFFDFDGEGFFSGDSFLSSGGITCSSEEEVKRTFSDIAAIGLTVDSILTGGVGNKLSSKTLSPREKHIICI